jgi:branched-chain amino acid aminotransferase
LGNYLDLSKGLSVCVSSWRRLGDNQIPPRTKAGGAYMNTALAVTDARRMGFDDAVFLTDAGHVSEGSAMNLFLIRHGKLITPGDTANILEGITRDTVIQIAKNELGLETESRTIDRTELYRADEAFFCGTGAQIAPITQFDNRQVGTGELGEITHKLQTLYFDVVKGKLPQYRHWCEKVPV